MKALPGIFAVALLLAAAGTAPVLAQDGGAVIISGGGGVTFTGVISSVGDGGLTKDGAGTLVLNSGTSTAANYTGGAGLTIESLLNNPLRLVNATNTGPVLPPTLFGSPTAPGGILTSGGTLSLTLGGAVTVLPFGWALNLGGAVPVGSLGAVITTGTLTLGTAGTIGTVTGGTLTITGPLYPSTGTGGTGVLTINSNGGNPFITGGLGTITGATTISAGTLVLNGNLPTLQTGSGTLEITAGNLVNTQTNTITLQSNLTPTPEPSSAALLALGLAVPLWRARKRLGRA
jgi:hypothetical protein